MAAHANLAASRREATGKSAMRKLRAEGKTPAVLYGRGEQTRMLTVDSHEVGLLFGRISVENTIIDLQVDGAVLPALVREVQVHPARQNVVHVDFYQIHAGEKLTVEVPITFVGNSEGVRAGGVLHPNISGLEVRCVAERIPEAIEVDVTPLQVGDSVHVRDLQVPDGVEILTDGDVTVCSVTSPTVTALETEATEEEGVGGEVEPALVRRRGEGVDDVPASEQGSH